MFSSSIRAKGARIWRRRRFSSAGPAIPALPARCQQAAGSQAPAVLLDAGAARQRAVRASALQASTLPASRQAEAARSALALEPAPLPAPAPPTTADVASAQPPA